MRSVLFATLAMLTTAVVAGPQSPALVPLPAKMAVAEAPGLTLTAESRIVADGAFLKEAAYAARELNRATGFDLKAEKAGWFFGTKGEITFREVSGLGPEAYRLTVSAEGALIEASAPAGAFYGFQTLRQLLPTAIYAKTPQQATWSIPAVTIEDAPRLPWRGVMVDDCRHFIGPDGFRAMVDAMAAHKLNTLHWHLTEDQGWRIEIRKYPQITLNGARRAESPVPGNRGKGDGKPYGWYYYTQEQVRELVAYAAERHVTVVPEIEMPGHALGLLTAFPDLGCTGGPYAPWCHWGVSEDIVCAGNDRVLKVYEDILDEVLALFPSKFIHCGGDEAPKTRWNACPKCQKRIADLGLGNSHRLQSWFMQHFANYLEARGRHMIGWDEILEGGLPKGAAVMSWRGPSGGIAAAKQGHDVVMSPNNFAYLDYGQGLPGDPYEYIGGNVPLAKSYSLNPTDGIPEAMQGHVIGVQGNLWSEYIWGAADQQWKAWPRAAALAEVGWTPQAHRDWDCFRARVETAVERLHTMGINAAPLPEKPFATWKPGDVPTEWVERTWDASAAVKDVGTYEVTFRFTGGDSRLDIRKVELLLNGAPVATDAHEGQAGSTHKGNVYRLPLKVFPGNVRFTLRAEVRTDGNDHSNGEITLRKVK